MDLERLRKGKCLLVDPEGNCHFKDEHRVVRWSVTNNRRIYYLDKGVGVQSYLDIVKDGSMHLYPSSRGHEEIINPLNNKELQRMFGKRIYTTSTCLEFYLDKADVVVPVRHSFTIRRVEYEIKLYAPQSNKILWQLQFAVFDAMNGNTPLDVYHSCDKKMFVDVCKNLNVRWSRDGMEPEDFRWHLAYVDDQVRLKLPETAFFDTGMFIGEFENLEVLVEKKKIENEEDGVQIAKKLRFLDSHENVLRFYSHKSNGSHHIFAFEMCEKPLHRMLTRFLNTDLTLRPQNISVWEDSPASSKWLRGLLEAIRFLHRSKFIHGNLKPENVFFSTDDAIKVSIFDARPVGNSNAGIADDLYQIGRLLLHIFSLRNHRVCYTALEMMKDFTPDINRLPTILEDAKCVIKKLLSRDPALQPQIGELIRHPFLWDSGKRIRFLTEVSDHVNAIPYQDTLVIELEKSWENGFTAACVLEMNIYRKYKYIYVHELLRFLRNLKNHRYELSHQVQDSCNKNDKQLDMHIRRTFPKLFLFVYELVKKYGGPRFKDYFEED